jgi:hypothetical protein
LRIMPRTLSRRCRHRWDESVEDDPIRVVICGPGVRRGAR